MPYQSKKLSTPVFAHQRGSTCGLYALEGVIRALDPNTTYRATAEGKTDVISLRDIAKNKLGITVIGEIFHASDLMALAKFIGLKAKLCTKTDWKKVIRDAIDSDKYVIAPFGVDAKSGQPQTTGANPHYCVVYAYAFWNGVTPPTTQVKMPFTSESWSPPGPPSLPRSYSMVRFWDKNHRFFMDDFRESSKALKKFPEQYWKKQRGTKDLEYAKVNPLGQKFSIFRSSSARKIPEANLPKTLADKLVVVGK